MKHARSGLERPVSCSTRLSVSVSVARGAGMRVDSPFWRQICVSTRCLSNPRSCCGRALCGRFVLPAWCGEEGGAQMRVSHAQRCWAGVTITRRKKEKKQQDEGGAAGRSARRFTHGSRAAAAGRLPPPTCHLPPPPARCCRRHRAARVGILDYHLHTALE